MSASFVSFDELRGRIRAAVEAAELPAGAPPVYVIRNLFGTVGISVSDEFEDDETLRDALDRLAVELHRRLGAHGRPAERLLLWVWPDLLEVLGAASQEIRPGVFLAERLKVCGDWWSLNGQRREGRAPRYTLYSVKGGLGRSTTVAALAWHLARHGENVLAVDLDLESPGLGPMLFEKAARPRFGVSDWFVEELVGQGELLLPDMVANPAWAADLPGTVWVAPAQGRDPGEYLAKLGRASMATASDPWTARLERLLERLEVRLEPTGVLLDSRSGFHDIGAAAVTDIGAEALLFAVDSPATWTGYRVLFEHWKALGLASRIRDRLSLVSGVTPETGTDRYLTQFHEKARHLVRDGLYESDAGGDESAADQASNGAAERDALHDPLVIHWSRALANGAALRSLDESVVTPAYGPFLRRFDRLHQGMGGPAIRRTGLGAVRAG